LNPVPERLGSMAALPARNDRRVSDEWHLVLCKSGRGSGIGKKASLA
jgi:hypothetical protein